MAAFRSEMLQSGPYPLGSRYTDCSMAQFKDILLDGSNIWKCAYDPGNNLLACGTRPCSPAIVDSNDNNRLDDEDRSSMNYHILSAANFVSQQCCDSVRKVDDSGSEGYGSNQWHKCYRNPSPTTQHTTADEYSHIDVVDTLSNLKVDPGCYDGKSLRNPPPWPLEVEYPFQHFDKDKDLSTNCASNSYPIATQIGNNQINASQSTAIKTSNTNLTVINCSDGTCNLLSNVQITDNTPVVTAWDNCTEIQRKTSLSNKRKHPSNSTKINAAGGGNRPRSATSWSAKSETIDNESTNGGEETNCTLKNDIAPGVVHVRARRGQATDSHSLAERVRREKISQRMKLLEGLVPGCNKVFGKATMLDEIINYVKSLQRQVEFLSMELAIAAGNNCYFNIDTYHDRYTSDEYKTNFGAREGASPFDRHAHI